jgi:hypothetical protein
MTSSTFARRAVASFPLRREGRAPVVFRDDGTTGCAAASTRGRSIRTSDLASLTPQSFSLPPKENIAEEGL